MDFYDRETLRFSKLIAATKERTDIDEETKKEIIDIYHFEILSLRACKTSDIIRGL